MIIYAFYFVKSLLKLKSMKKPIISVIVPAYNEEKRIKSCLESTVNQDFKKEYEVILVDNNSTDNTVKIARKFFPLVRIVPEHTQGVYFARFRGVKEAKGEIITFTDADSIVPKFWISNIVKAFKNQNVSGVGGTVSLTPKNGWISICESLVNCFNLNLKTFHGANMSFKKEAYFKCGGFLPKLNLGEDFYLSIRLKRVGKVEVIENKVITSSRRFFDGFYCYAFEYLSNMVSLYLFDRPVFYKLRNLKEKASAALDLLEDKNFP